MIEENVGQGKYFISNATNSVLTVESYRNGEKLELINDVIKPNSKSQIYLAIEMSSGHVYPSNFFDEFYVINNTDTIYQGINDNDWVLEDSNSEYQKLTLGINQVSRKEYVFALVSSQEECDNYMTSGVNCTQAVKFLDDRKVEVIITDIVNQGTYAVIGNTITITINKGDAENPVIFNANDDFTELTRTSDGSNDIWKLQIPGVLPWNL